ncbi:MAG: ATP-dependent DNA helicase [Burkholderiales bacterium]
MTLLKNEVRAVFSESGPLAQSGAENYQWRRSQVEMAEAVAQTIHDQSSLVVEAGTGVGKTFAYLVPLLLSGTKVLVSTATKSLQDQLYLRDLPRLSQILNVPLASAMLKGRSSYLCLHRLGMARHEEILGPGLIRTLAKIERWAQDTRTGDLAEIEGLDERNSVIPLVTSTRDNCIGTECSHFKSCHVFRARREAMLADVVVVNHHLFFADLNLRDTGVAELLPSVNAVVFDEAHQLLEAGVHFLGHQLGSAQLIDFGQDILCSGLSDAKGLRPWAEWVNELEQSIQRWRQACVGPADAHHLNTRLPWAHREFLPEFGQAMNDLAKALQQIHSGLSTVAEASADLTRLCERAAGLVSRVEAFAQPHGPNTVRWIELGSLHMRLVESPLDIRATMRAQIDKTPKAWVFTSATLGDDASLSWFTQAAGLEDAKVLRLDSPFNYAQQARVYIPSVFPLPHDEQHSKAVAALAARCALALAGRTFVLTTSLRALRSIAAFLKQELAHHSDGLKVLQQGEMPKRQLIEQFMHTSGSILVGSQSFWEGIDIPGDALQCVLIDKLPFPPPNDPWVEARVVQLQQMGHHPFTDLFLAEAAIALKQGAGRLIRSETDTGLLVICDPRMRKMGYGQRLKAALPPMAHVQSEAQALEWLQAIRPDRALNSLV